MNYSKLFGYLLLIAGMMGFGMSCGLGDLPPHIFFMALFGVITAQGGLFLIVKEL